MVEGNQFIRACWEEREERKVYPKSHRILLVELCSRSDSVGINNGMEGNGRLARCL